MRNWPTDPIRQHALFIDALCDDFLETGKLSLDSPRAKTVSEISRQINENNREAGSAEQAPASNS